jgi:Phosphotransferase enzyme family
VTRLLPALIDEPDQLTPAWFTDALRAGGVLEDDGAVVAAEVHRFGTGQWGLVVRATLEYTGATGSAPASVIVKIPSSDASSRQLGLAMGAYEAEVRFYREVLPRAAVRAPRLYWGEIENDSGRFTLVLEDLSTSWEVGNMLAGGTVAQAQAALAQLVKLQAPLWNDSSLGALNWLSSRERVQAFFDVVEPALPKFRERFESRLSPTVMALVERLAPRAKQYPARAWHEPLVVVHSDYRLDNLLFRHNDEGAVEAAVLDWQSVRVGPPLIDASIYLATCLSRELRRAHQDDLLAGYHDGLCRSGVTGFSLADVHESFRQASLYSFLLGIATSISIQQTDRGDAMFTALISLSADLVIDVGATDFLD